MKTLIIEGPPLLASAILNYDDSSLESIRGLMDLGCFGPLNYQDLADESHPKWVIHSSFDPNLTSWTDRLQASSQLWNAQDWECWHHQDLNSHASSTEIDSAIGSILETLDNETVLLIMARSASSDQQGAFVLVVPKLPAKGLLEGVGWSNLRATLLELAGHELEPDQKALSLASKLTEGMTADDFDEEAIVRDRLLGLGYLG